MAFLQKENGNGNEKTRAVLKDRREIVKFYHER